MNIGRPVLFVSTLLVTGISVFASQNVYMAKPVDVSKSAVTLLAAARARAQPVAVDQRLIYSRSVIAVANSQMQTASPGQSIATDGIAGSPLPSFSFEAYSPAKVGISNKLSISSLSGSSEIAPAFVGPPKVMPQADDALRARTSSPVSNAINVARILPPSGRSMTGAAPSRSSLTGNNKAYIDQISIPPVPSGVDEARGESLVYIQQADEFDFSQFEQFGATRYAKVSEAGSGKITVEYGNDSNGHDEIAADGAAADVAPAGSGEQADNTKSHSDQSAGTGVLDH